MYVLRLWFYCVLYDKDVICAPKTIKMRCSCLNVKCEGLTAHGEWDELRIERSGLELFRDHCILGQDTLHSASLQPGV